MKLAGPIGACVLLALSPAANAEQGLWEEATTAYETQHFDLALSLYERLASGGNAQAAEIAGTMLLYGEALYGAPVRRDRFRAALLLQRAAQAGRPAAGFLLGRMSVAHSAAAVSGADSDDAWSEPSPFDGVAR